MGKVLESTDERLTQQLPAAATQATTHQKDMTENMTATEDRSGVELSKIQKVVAMAATEDHSGVELQKVTTQSPTSPNEKGEATEISDDPSSGIEETSKYSPKKNRGLEGSATFLLKMFDMLGKAEEEDLFDVVSWVRPVPCAHFLHSLLLTFRLAVHLAS